jgi:hypothetical protein
VIPNACISPIDVLVARISYKPLDSVVSENVIQHTAVICSQAHPGGKHGIRIHHRRSPTLPPSPQRWFRPISQILRRAVRRLTRAASRGYGAAVRGGPRRDAEQSHLLLRPIQGNPATSAIASVRLLSSSSCSCAALTPLPPPKPLPLHSSCHRRRRRCATPRESYSPYCLLSL